MKEKKDSFKKMKEDMIAKHEAQHKHDLEYKNKFMHMNEKIQECTQDVEAKAKEHFEAELKEYHRMKHQAIQERKTQVKNDHCESERIVFLEKQKKMADIKAKFEAERARKER